MHLWPQPCQLHQTLLWCWRRLRRQIHFLRTRQLQSLSRRRLYPKWRMPLLCRKSIKNVLTIQPIMTNVFAGVIWYHVLLHWLALVKLAMANTPLANVHQNIKSAIAVLNPEPPLVMLTASPNTLIAKIAVRTLAPLVKNQPPALIIKTKSK